jgi:hypothetical protein
VGLRFQGAPRLEVLTHPAHGRHTETGERRNFSGAFALFVKVDDSFADWKRDRSHGHTLPHRPVFVKLYYLCKCFNKELTPKAEAKAANKLPKAEQLNKFEKDLEVHDSGNRPA